mmetsp:Transcript_903/g.1872  ORF Transcript_903/g.1872 Transcript_903/m.1872 type:complete len:229 (+) Transcript_903:249-935(+)
MTPHAIHMGCSQKPSRSNAHTTTANDEPFVFITSLVKAPHLPILQLKQVTARTLSQSRFVPKRIAKDCRPLKCKPEKEMMFPTPYAFTIKINKRKHNPNPHISPLTNKIKQKAAAKSTVTTAIQQMRTQQTMIQQNMIQQIMTMTRLLPLVLMQKRLRQRRILARVDHVVTAVDPVETVRRGAPPVPLMMQRIYIGHPPKLPIYLASQNMTTLMLWRRSRKGFIFCNR